MMSNERSAEHIYVSYKKCHRIQCGVVVHRRDACMMASEMTEPDDDAVTEGMPLRVLPSSDKEHCAGGHRSRSHCSRQRYHSCCTA